MYQSKTKGPRQRMACAVLRRLATAGACALGRCAVPCIANVGSRPQLGDASRSSGHDVQLTSYACGLLAAAHLADSPYAHPSVLVQKGSTTKPGLSSCACCDRCTW